MINNGMKNIIAILCFALITLAYGSVFAHKNVVQTSSPIAEQSDLNQYNTDTFDTTELTIAPFVGVWVLERTVEDADGQPKNVYPGTFMIIHNDAAYTIFVHTDLGAVITSQGRIIVESDNVFIEDIKHHVNKSLIGVSNKIDYELNFGYLQKSFWIEKDLHGNESERKVNETWKRATMPVGTF